MIKHKLLLMCSNTISIKKKQKQKRITEVEPTSIWSFRFGYHLFPFFPLSAFSPPIQMNVLCMLNMWIVENNKMGILSSEYKDLEYLADLSPLEGEDVTKW